MKICQGLLVLFALCLVLPLPAALTDYAFSQAIGSYTEIGGGILLGNEATDEQRFLDPALPLGTTSSPFTGPGFPIGFAFNFNNASFDMIAVNANGWISFGQSALGTAAVDLTCTNAYSPLSTVATPAVQQLANRAAAFGRDIQAQAGASLRIETIGAAPNRTCVIQWKNYRRYGPAGDGDQLNFQILLRETANQISFQYGMFLILNPNPSEVQVGLRGHASTDFQNRASDTDWTSTTPGTVNSASVTLSSTSFPFPGLSFTFTPPAVYQHDLKAAATTGDALPIQDSLAVYRVLVQNNGSQAQLSYLVKLISGGLELAAVSGPALGAGQSAQVSLSCAFSTTGPTGIFGRVELAADENPANNDTPVLHLNVLASGIVPVTLGEGDVDFRAPLDFYWKSSLYECVYPAAQISSGGTIGGIAFYNDFTSAYPPGGKPTRVWLGEIAAADLAAGWIPSTQLTQVFDGNVIYPAGQNTVVVSFPVPYNYTGGNLVMLVQRPLDTFYYAVTDYFKCQDATAPVARRLVSDTVELDPAAPAASEPITTYPKATLFFDPSGSGVLEGTVTAGATPLDSACVTVAGTMLTAFTSSAGTYHFSYVPQGERQVTCSRPGYQPQTVTLTIAAGQTATQDFNLTPVPLLQVTGLVTGSDHPSLGLAGATVHLDGSLDYTVITDAAGQFVISGVGGFETYQCSVVEPGGRYWPYNGPVTLDSADLDLGTIILEEIAWPVSSVEAELVTGGVDISWTAAVYKRERDLSGFQVWRLLQGEEEDEPAWTLLTETPITPTWYIDSGWDALPNGWYKWAVKALYSNGVLSVAALSNPLQQENQAAGDETAPVPASGLCDIYPNPFKGPVSIVYALKDRSLTQIAVYDVKGRKVRSLAGGEKLPGIYTAVWDGRDDGGGKVAPGVYLVRMQAGKDRFARKAVLWR